MKPRVLPPEIVARLGTVSDHSIAREIGVAATTVFKWRTERGIAAYQPKLPWYQGKQIRGYQGGTHDDMTEAELDAVIEEQSRCKPSWWQSESQRNAGVDWTALAAMMRRK